PPGNGGGTYTAHFTTSATGTITISMPPGSYLGKSGGATVFFNFSLSGPGSGSGSLCNNSTPGYTCSVSNSVPFNNMPAGDYTLTVNPSTNTASATVQVQYTFPGLNIVPTGNTEFFYEGFEQSPFGVAGSAHTGAYYYGGDYTTTFTPPNSRQYLIQWFSL